MKNYVYSVASVITSMMIANAAMGQDQDTTDTDENVDVIEVVGQVSTFGATKSDIPILETSRSVSVIKAEEFLEKGSLTLDDTLNYTAGVVGDTFGFSTRGDFPTVRGLDVPEYLDNVQVLFGSYNNARSDIYTLEQVEVLKGPASVLYGQGSPGGILNTISKKASSENDIKEIVVDYGTNDRKQVAVDVGGVFTDDGKLSGRLVALYRDSGTQLEHVNDDAVVFAPSFTYEDESTRFTTLLNYTDRKSDTAHQFLPLFVTACGSNNVNFSNPAICTGATGAEVDPNVYVGDPGFNRYDTKSLSVTSWLVHEFDDVFSFEATARYRDNEADYKQTWISFLGEGTPRTLPNGTALARSWYDAPASSDQIAVDSRFRAKFDTDFISHEVLLGANFQDVDTLQEAAYLYGLPTTFNIFTPDYSGAEIPDIATFDAARGRSESNTQTFGFYLNDQITVDNFVLNAGIRYDEVETFNGTDTQKDDAISLSFGALYKTEIGLNPYISYAESFQAVVGLDTTTNQALKPQRGKQIEVGVKYQPTGTRTYITAAYFDIDQSNLPNPNGLPNATSQQEGIAHIKGFELEAQTIIGEFRIDGSFSVLDTEDPNGVKFPSVPKYQASGWVTWEPADGPLAGLRIGAGARHAGGNESQGAGFNVLTDGYTVFDGLIGYEYADMLFTLNFRNIADTKYYGTCLSRGDCFPGEGRTIVGRMKYNF